LAGTGVLSRILLFLSLLTRRVPTLLILGEKRLGQALWFFKLCPCIHTAVLSSMSQLVLALKRLVTAQRTE
jgi:hypothetical protein